MTINIPNKATNGDIIKYLFANLKYVEHGDSITLYFDKRIGTIVTSEWWNKRYKFIELEQSRCNSCLNNTDELSGECYECVKGIEDRYEPISELKVNKPTCNNSECIEFDCEFYENNNSTRYGYCWASGCCTNEIDFDEVKGNKE